MDTKTSAPDARGVATLTITGSGPLNIINAAAIAESTRAIEALTGNDAIRVLVLRGASDRSFIGGVDVKEMAALTPKSAEHFISQLRALCDAVRHFPVPVIARLPGWCLGGGLELAMACDLRIAATDARLGMPEVKVGIPSVIHAALMPRLIGHARATWMLLTGEPADASQALAWGLVHTTVEPPQLDAEVERTAALLAGFGPAVLRQQKRMLREWEDAPLDTSIERSVAEFGRAFSTGEPQHYMNAFLNRKR